MAQPPQSEDTRLPLDVGSAWEANNLSYRQCCRGSKDRMEIGPEYTVFTATYVEHRDISGGGLSHTHGLHWPIRGSHVIYIHDYDNGGAEGEKVFSIKSSIPNSRLFPLSLFFYCEGNLRWDLEKTRDIRAVI